MSKLKRSQISLNIASRYPDNTDGEIVPGNDRAQHTDLTDSFINEIEDVGSGTNSGFGGKNFPEILDPSEIDVDWNLDYRLDGKAYLETDIDHNIHLHNFRPGTKRELIIKKTTDVKLVFNFVSAELIDFFDLEASQANAGWYAKGLTGRFFKLTFYNFNNFIYWDVSAGRPIEEDLDTSVNPIQVLFVDSDNVFLLKGDTDIAAAKTWTFIFAGPGQLLKATIIINVTDLPAVQTFPVSVKRSNVYGDWDPSSHEWAPASIGVYKLDLTKYGTTYLLDIEGPF